MNSKITFSNRGQTITQALISVAISAIAIAAIVTTTVAMMRSNKQLAQKLEAIDIKNQLQSTFLNPANCTCQLSATANPTNSENLIFDSTKVASMNLKKFKLSCASDAQTVVEENKLALGTLTNLKVRAVELVDIQSTGNVEEYLGTVRISFDESSLAGPLAPLQFKQKFYGDPAAPPDKKVVLGCQSDYGIKVASGNNLIGANNAGNLTIDLATYGFDPLGKDPHIIVAERDSNYDGVDGNTVDATFCGFQRDSKLVFTVTCWASPNNSDGTVRSSFDWMALQK
jgi:hypothetical protein